MITLIVVHVTPSEITTKVLSVDVDSSRRWTGTFGNIEEDYRNDDGKIKSLIDHLGIEYNNYQDNLRIDELLYQPITNIFKPKEK